MTRNAPKAGVQVTLFDQEEEIKAIQAEVAQSAEQFASCTSP